MKRSWLLLSVGVLLAVWFSDRWMWMLPVFFGVPIGVALIKQRPRQRSARGDGTWPGFLGFLLIFVSAVYLGAICFVFQLGRILELFRGDEPISYPSGWLAVGFGFGAIGLCCLFGLAAVFLLNITLPGWLMRVWDWLLEER